MGEDRISNLPNHVMDHILSYLLIKEAGKTSVLSRKWRSKWTTVPCLVFTDHSLPLLHDQQESAVSKFVNCIDRILLLHSGPIDKCVIQYLHEELPDHDELPIDDIDKWILHISRHPIRDFTLSTPNSENYKMPSCFFSCQNLTCLVLNNCLLESPPSAFKGFRGLKRLTLIDVSLHQDMFEILMSSCMLEDLCLLFVSGVDNLNINAPNLKQFFFKKELSSTSNHTAYQVTVNAPNLQDCSFFEPLDYLCLKNTSRLTELALYPPEFHTGHNITLLKLLANLTRIESLDIDCFAFESLDFGAIPSALLSPYLYLHYLLAVINFSSLKGTSGLCCLLRSVPNLQTLVISSFGYNIGESIVNNVWQADQWNSPFACLQIVQIINFCGSKDELDFIKFILLTSPLLVKMIIKLSRSRVSIQRILYGPDTDTKVWKIMLLQLQSIKCASPSAQIIFDDELGRSSHMTNCIHTN